MGARKVTIISYDCPGCGASIQLNPGQTSATCEYCGNHFSVETESVPTRVQSSFSGVNRNRQNNLRVLIPIIVIGVVIGGSILFTLLIGLLGAFSSSRGSTQRTEEQLVEVDPFKDIKVIVQGMEPWAKVTSVTNGDTSYGRITYNVDKKSGLSNGDVITIQAEEMKGYKWTNSTYEYTVSGLDTIVTELDQLSEADRDFLFQEAKKEIEKNWETNLKNCDFTVEDIGLSVQPYKIYINVSNNEEAIYYSSSNIVYPAFETTFERNGKKYTYYQIADIDNVYLGSDESLHGDFNTMSAINGFRLFQESNDMFSIDGFESVLKMESYMEKDGFRLVK